MSYAIPFAPKEPELPAWARDYDPDDHPAEVTLRDLHHLAERIGREHYPFPCWVTNADGKLALVISGHGSRCKHLVAVGRKDSFRSILHRVDEAVNQHIDECLGRSKTKTAGTRQLTLFA